MKIAETGFRNISYRFEVFVYFNGKGFKYLQNDVIGYFSFEDPIEKLR